ncbi:MAG UNVERIFIED_CONTAM: hypothetical protein LVR18_13565 [Planctomycetaceae bacterium]
MPSNDRELLPEALRLSSQAVKAAPGSHYMLTTRAEVQLALGDLRSAFGDLEQARQLRPDFPETLQLLAKVSVEQGICSRPKFICRKQQSCRKHSPEEPAG